jgi:hypothetical protein
MRTRKTASTSIQAALGEFCGPQDIISGAELDMNRNDSYIRRPHESIIKVRFFLGRDWKRLFKFAFVRNPWDLVLSRYFHIRISKGQEYGREDFSEWVKTYPRERRKKFLKNRQCLYICMWGKIALDFVGRFEDLQRDFSCVCERIGIPATCLERHNAQFRDFVGYRDYYDDESREIIGRLFKKDIELFGYEF